MGVLGEAIKIRLRGAVLRVHPLHLILDFLTLLIAKEQVFRQIHTTNPATTGPAAVDDCVTSGTIHDGSVGEGSSGFGNSIGFGILRSQSSRTPTMRESQATTGSISPTLLKLSSYRELCTELFTAPVR